jgi:secreted PhoX family phosphatase
MIDPFRGDGTDPDDTPIRRETGEPFHAILGRRLSRRAVLKGATALTAMGALGPLAACGRPEESLTTLDFTDIAQVITETDAVAAGYRADVVIRWGDPVLPGAPAFDPNAQSVETQAAQFGYNNDYTAYFPLPRGSESSGHGLLWVNHEYTNPMQMYPDFSLQAYVMRQARIDMAAHGGSVIEVKRGADGRWAVVPDSAYARRITAFTEMAISGPARGHARMTTPEDPDGVLVTGMLNNCAGGRTPWGTVLTAEENTHVYFGGADPDATEEAANHRRMGVVADSIAPWHMIDPRFHIGQAPNAPNRFGWIVEIDPYDPQSTPVKRTALGRFKHEGAETIINRDGRLVVYSGDDQAFEYIYKFVSRDRVNLDDRAANRDLLDHGTLYVARFDEEHVHWLPLVHGEGPLTPENGFHSQADVVIEARRAADLLGATPMDRPEDVEANPVNGRVYAMLTNNKDRTAAQTDTANPRAANMHGHILEMVPPGADDGEADHAATMFTWSPFILAGDEASGARYHPATGVWFSSPDNCAFDPRGRLYVATDQDERQTLNGVPDGIYACDVSGPGRALVRQLYATPIDAEMCGPCFTPDGTTLFVAVQHPGEGSTYADPSTRWPDFRDDMPPRPSVVAITREDGGPIGG